MTRFTVVDVGVIDVFVGDESDELLQTWHVIIQLVIGTREFPRFFRTLLEQGASPFSVGDEFIFIATQSPEEGVSYGHNFRVIFELRFPVEAHV